MHISTSVLGAQNPNAGQNIQQIDDHKIYLNTNNRNFYNEGTSEV